MYSAILYGPPGTGKTTLAESLAYSSGVPLVRLSPSDLTVEGQELIEGRARVVFEALSMLTQTVILLDEFEPVLHRRPQILKVGNKTGNSDDPKYKFLLTGMLPKLAKLHAAAQKQALVYFLATNKIGDIDEAAKREGRFDKHLPVYNPDPLSRAGSFLFRLQLRLREEPGSEIDKTKLKEFLRVIRHTSYVPASKLAEEYFKLKSPYLNYFLTGQKGEELNVPQSSLKSEEDNIDFLKTLKNLNDKDLESELQDRLWLLGWERALEISTTRKVNTRMVLKCLDPRTHYQ